MQREVGRVGFCYGQDRVRAELTYKVPLPVGDVAADVASLLVVQLQVDLGKERKCYTATRKRVKEAHTVN